MRTVRAGGGLLHVLMLAVQLLHVGGAGRMGSTEDPVTRDGSGRRLQGIGMQMLNPHFGVHTSRSTGSLSGHSNVQVRAQATEERKGSGKGGKGKKLKKKKNSGLFGVHSSVPVHSGNWVHASGPVPGDFSSPERDEGKQLLRCGDTTVDDVAVGVLARRAFNTVRNKQPEPAPDGTQPRKTRYFQLSAAGGQPSFVQRFRDVSGHLRAPAPSGKHQRAAVRAGWLRWFPHAAFFLKQAGAAPLDLLLVLLRLHARFPDKSWYVLTHDDTYMHAYHLLCELRGNSPARSWYAGVQHCTRALGLDQELFQCDADGGSGLTGWINGGAGVVLSRAMVKRMVMSECLHRYAWRWRRTSLSGADVVLACCVADVDPIVSTGDNTRVHLPGFVAGPPGFYECQCKGKAVGDKEVACGVQRPDLARAPWRQVSYHGVNATLMRHLALLDFGHRKYDVVRSFADQPVVYLYPREVRQPMTEVEKDGPHQDKYLYEWRMNRENIDRVLADPVGVGVGLVTGQQIP